MDFEEIDRVLGDSLTIGDIVTQDGEFHQIRRDDEADDLLFATYNLSTGDEDELIVDPDAVYRIFQVQ